MIMKLNKDLDLQPSFGLVANAQFDVVKVVYGTILNPVSVLIKVAYNQYAVIQDRDFDIVP